MNPFSARYSPEFPKVLEELDGTIILTTYQTGKVIFLSTKDGKLTQLVREFDRPMGVSFHGELMAMALRTNITVFKNSKSLAKTYPKKENVYDSLYYPTAINITSYIDTHDITFSQSGLVGVNTSYSCLVKVDGQNSFEPIWFPPFIKEFASGDACHLNGVCVDENSDLRYITAFAKSTEPGGWRLNKLTTGILYDIKEQKYLCEDLPMPHSPRVYKDELYVLLSASEELVKVDRVTGEKELITKIDGFIRGLSFYKNYAFIGVSKLRKSHTFGDLPIAKKRLYAGCVIVDLTTKEKVAEVFYDDALEEVYDVAFIPNAKRVNILNHQMIQTTPAIITSKYEQWIKNKDETNEKDTNPKKGDKV